MPLRHSLKPFAAALAGAAVWAAPLQAAPAVEAGPVRAVEASVAVDEGVQPFRLSAPRPNPFSASTRLELTVDEPTDLTVAVFDALGRRVSLLHEGLLRPSTYTLRVNAADLPPGLYLVRATDGRGNTATRSVALVR